MTGGHKLRAIIVAGALASFFAAVSEANAGGFAVGDQSTYFTGTANAGAAAGVDISSMYWNPAATAAQPGLNSSSSYYGFFVNAPEHATGGTFTQFGLPNSTNVGTDAAATASYLTYQQSDRLYFGLALNAPFGLTTKPDTSPWAGSPIANTTRIFTLEANPTIAYKLTPEITIGAGAQIEYVLVKLDRGSLSPGGEVIAAQRSFEGDNVGGGGTAGVIWQPMPGTSLGVGYRSSVDVSPSGSYSRGAFVIVPPGIPVPGVQTNATASLTLPDLVTASFRQIVTQQLTIMGTVEWQNWSTLKNVNATSPVCAGNVCETINLNYRNSWFFSLGAEYAYDPQWTFRVGVGYEMSPITDATRDILVPDANRVQVGVGASYKWSDKIVLNAAYSHIFLDNAPFCIANPLVNGTTHCISGSQILLQGSAEPSADIVSVGLNYKLSGPAPLEPLK